jgi:plastocyanin
MKWQHIFFLPLVRCFEAGNAVNGATSAVNDTAPTVAEGEINVHSIEVSRREHLFTPNSINALPGDIVTFKFWPGSHSVIRASYGRPCEPYENVQGNEGQGFYSGIMSPDEVDVEQGSVRRCTTTGAGRH